LRSYRPTLLVSSAIRRAIDTATPIAIACGLPPQTVEPLHERRMGPLSGQLRAVGVRAYHDAKQRWESGELNWTHEGGESYADIRARVLPVWQELAARASGQTMVIVAHGVVIRVLITTLVEGLSHADFSRIGIDHVAVNDLRWDGSRWRGAGLNQKLVELDL
jgi:broad specificity phosphatase PhoE